MILDFKLVFFVASSILCSLLLSICVFLVATSSVFPVVKRSKKEKYFIDPKTGETHPFPKITDPAGVNLSIIIPSYNEENRLRPMLDECIEYLEKRLDDFKYEIIVVSDGSTDKTVSVANEYGNKLGTDKFRILELWPNRGKGGAVRLGVQSARGALLLFADADGATKFSDLEKLESELQNTLNCDYRKNPDGVARKVAIIVGSRAHLEQEAISSRSIFRTILMYGFHFLVWLFTVRGIRDTQCGFKLFTRSAAQKCFDSLHVERWAFDVEILYIAEKLRIPISEVAVNWSEIDGSKVTPVLSWIQMGMDLGLIWLRYTIGAWKIAPSSKTH